MYPLLKLFFAALFLLVTGCNLSNSSGPSETSTITIQPNTTTLYFTGSIAPLQIFTISSPIDAGVIQKSFEYGETVKPGQVVLILASPQLTQDYQSALADYLKVKKDYKNNEIELRGIDFLKKSGIISENEYINSKSTYYDLQLAYNQARQKLQAILDKTANPVAADIFQVSIENVNDVNKALTKTVNTLKVIAPTVGVALLPEKGTGNSNNNATPLAIGSQVKTGDALLNIGDMSGLTVEVKVNEMHINDLKVGQAATITGDGFPNITLEGHIAHVAQQAVPSETGGSPVFLVKVVVPNLTNNQRAVIHVGMSAKVKITYSASTIKIPIQAVFTQNGTTMVYIIDAKTGKKRAVPVVTGGTTLDSVEITQGLKIGDQVVNSSH